MLGPNHAKIGAAAGVAVSHLLGQPAAFALARRTALHPFGATLSPELATVLGEVVADGQAVFVAGLAALLPDLDEPGSTLGKLLPQWWHDWTPGHRGVTHSVLAVATWSAATWLVWYLGVLTMATAAPAPVVAVAAVQMARTMTLLVAVGYVSHLVADSMTDHGVRWLYLPPALARLLPSSLERLTQVHVRLPLLAFRTGSWPEPVTTYAWLLLVAYEAYGGQHLVAWLVGSR